MRRGSFLTSCYQVRFSGGAVSVGVCKQRKHRKNTSLTPEHAPCQPRHPPTSAHSWIAKMRRVKGLANHELMRPEVLENPSSRIETPEVVDGIYHWQSEQGRWKILTTAGVRAPRRCEPWNQYLKLESRGPSSYVRS